MIYPTSQKLADAIAAEPCAPQYLARRHIMVRGALQNHYHDLFGHTALPQVELRDHLLAIGLTALADRVVAGEFDATDAESEAWAASLEGINAGLGGATADTNPGPPDAPREFSLGDAPIEEQFRAQMKMMAEVNDSLLNGEAKGKDRQNGFVLLVFPFAGHDGRCNFISNGADRADIVVLFKEMIARFEGQPEAVGNG